MIPFDEDICFKTKEYITIFISVWKKEKIMQYNAAFIHIVAFITYLWYFCVLNCIYTIIFLKETEVLIQDHSRLGKNIEINQNI